MYKKIKYSELNPRQQESHNFHKVAARLADNGFNCVHLTDDWQGADAIAIHIDGETYLKIQLKGRCTINQKYQGKNILIAFIYDGIVHLYDHDKFIHHIRGRRGQKLLPVPPGATRANIVGQVSQARPQSGYSSFLKRTGFWNRSGCTTRSRCLPPNRRLDRFKPVGLPAHTGPIKPPNLSSASRLPSLPGLASAPSALTARRRSLRPVNLRY